MTASDAYPAVAAGHVVAGRYRLVSHLATGGMADVWEGVDEVLTRAVAIKILRPHLAADPDFQERFRREAIAAARLSHPAIVATYDAGIDGDLTYIVMELVRGNTLAHALRTNGALPATAAVGIAVQITGALAHAHAAGICHRDIKPSNILLCDDIAPGRVKIADFGIAKAAGSGEPDLTQTGAIVGTARYLAPEQVDGREPDPRSDLYALGAVLFEMVTGRPPFDGPTELAVALAHLHDPPPRPRKLRAGIPRPVEMVVLRLLEKDPGARFANATQLRDALAAIDIEDDDAEIAPAPAATPPGGVSVSARPARRPRTPIVIVGAAVITAGIAIATLLSSDDDQGANPATEAAAVPLTPTAVVSFDPQGDGRENDREAPRVADGDPTTAWETERYDTRAFGNLKDGVGLVLRLDSPTRLKTLTVLSTSEDWSAAVYVSTGTPATLPAWGEPVDTAEALTERATFDLKGRQGRAVLLWITDPGSTNRTTITEAALSSS